MNTAVADPRGRPPTGNPVSAPDTNCACKVHIWRLVQNEDKDQEGPLVEAQPPTFQPALGGGGSCKVRSK